MVDLSRQFKMGALDKLCVKGLNAYNAKLLWFTFESVSLSICMYVCMYLLIGKEQSAQKRPYWGENGIKRKNYE